MERFEIGLPTLTPENIMYCAVTIMQTPLPDLIGSVIVELARKKIRTLKLVPIDNPPTIVTDRCKQLAQHCAKKCTYESTRDKPLHNILRLHLPAHAEAALCDETPYDAVNRSFPGLQTNEIERPWICATPEDIVNRVTSQDDARSHARIYIAVCGLLYQVDFDSPDPKGLSVVANMINEHMDHTNMRVYVNGTVLQATQPALFAFRGFADFSDAMGVYTDNKLYFAKYSNQICSVITKFAECTENKTLHQALTNPSDLPPGCYFKSM